MSVVETNQYVEVILVIYSPVIFIINALLITSFIATKQPTKNASNLMIVVISIADCITGAVCMPLILTSCYWPKQNIQPLYMGSLFVVLTFPGISITLTLLVGIDRYLHMNPDINRPPSRLQRFFKIPLIYGVICCDIFLVVVFSALHAITLLLWPKMNIYFSVFMTIGMLIYMGAILVVYIRGYRKVYRHVRENAVHLNPQDESSAEEPLYVRELYKTVLLLLIAALVSCIGFLIWSVTIFIIETNNKLITPWEYYPILSSSTVIFFSNAFTNALIVLYRNRKCREWMRKKKDSILCCCCCCKSESKEVNLDNVAVVIPNVETRNF